MEKRERGREKEHGLKTRKRKGCLGNALFFLSFLCVRAGVTACVNMCMCVWRSCALNCAFLSE